MIKKNFDRSNSSKRSEKHICKGFHFFQLFDTIKEMISTCYEGGRLILIDTNVIIDFAILAALAVGSVAFMGTISNVIGMKIFGGRSVNRYRDKTLDITKGWKPVGGKQQAK